MFFKKYLRKALQIQFFLLTLPPSGRFILYNLYGNQTFSVGFQVLVSQARAYNRKVITHVSHSAGPGVPRHVGRKRNTQACHPAYFL